MEKHDKGSKADEATNTMECSMTGASQQPPESPAVLAPEPSKCCSDKDSEPNAQKEEHTDLQQRKSGAHNLGFHNTQLWTLVVSIIFNILIVGGGSRFGAGAVYFAVCYCIMSILVTWVIAALLKSWFPRGKLVINSGAILLSVSAASVYAVIGARDIAQSEQQGKDQKGTAASEPYSQANHSVMTGQINAVLQSQQRMENSIERLLSGSRPTIDTNELNREFPLGFVLVYASGNKFDALPLVRGEFVWDLSVVKLVNLSSTHATFVAPTIRYRGEVLEGNEQAFVRTDEDQYSLGQFWEIDLVGRVVVNTPDGVAFVWGLSRNFDEVHARQQLNKKLRGPKPR